MDIVAFDIGTRNFAMAWVRDCPETGQIVRYISLIDLTEKTSVPSKGWGVYRRLISHLESMDWIFREYRPLVLIEQQMSSRHKSNIQALRLSQHVLAYFLIRYPSLTIVEYSPRLKTNVFGYHEKSYKRRKQWAVDKIARFIENDPVTTDWFQQFRKKDDIADCILMCLAYLESIHKSIHKSIHTSIHTSIHNPA